MYRWCKKQLLSLINKLMFLKQNDKTAISFTGFTDSASKSTTNVHDVLGHHAPFHSESCGGH
jgi:hypothetical protein